jgi:hypothetical protein
MNRPKAKAGGGKREANITNPASLATHIDALLGELRGDARSRAAAEDLVRSLMAFYGAALTRVMDFVDRAEGGAELLERMVGDPLVAAVLLLHDLHPDPPDLPLDAGSGRSPLIQIRRADGTAVGSIPSAQRTPA